MASSQSLWDILELRLHCTDSHVIHRPGCTSFIHLREMVWTAASRITTILQCWKDQSFAERRFQTSFKGEPECAGVSVTYHTDITDRPPVICLVMHQGLQYIALVLAIIKTRYAAFMPVDPSWPSALIADVIRMATPDLIITADDLDPTLLAAVHSSATNQSYVYTASSILNHTNTDSDEDCSDQAQRSAHVDQQRSERAYCYVLFTSGSTGQPQGVCGTEGGLINRIKWMQHKYHIGKGDVVAVKTAVSFVDHLWEMLGPIACGANLHILPRHIILQPSAVAQALREGGITVFVSVPSVLRLLVPHLKRRPDEEVGLQKLRLLVSSGEPLSWSLCHQLMGAIPHTCRLLNLYGSTEVAADCTYYDARETHTQHTQRASELSAVHPSSAKLQSASYASRSEHPVPSASTPHAGHALDPRQELFVPAGKPIYNMAIMVLPIVDLDNNMEWTSTSMYATGNGAASHSGVHAPAQDATPVAHGQQGQIVVLGAGVARCYLNYPDATSARFKHIRLAQANDIRWVLLPQHECETHATTSAADNGQHSGQSVIPAGAGRIPTTYHITSRLQSVEGCEAFFTGDLGYVNDAGDLVVQGRIDNQVKINGIRVDILAVEQVLRQQVNVVKDAAVCLLPASKLPSHHNQDDGMILVAVVVPENSEHTFRPAGSGDGDDQAGLIVRKTEQHAPLSDATAAVPAQLPSAHPMCCHLRAAVRQVLPAASVPSVFVTVPVLPRNPAGKLLRAALPQMIESASFLPSKTMLVQGPALRPSAAPPAVQHTTHDSPAGSLITQNGTTSGVAIASQHQPPGSEHHRHLTAGGVVQGRDSRIWSEVDVIRVVVHEMGDISLEPCQDYMSAGLTSLKAVAVACQLHIEPQLVLAAGTVRQLTKLLNASQASIVLPAHKDDTDHVVKRSHDDDVELERRPDDNTVQPVAKRSRKQQALDSPSSDHSMQHEGVQIHDDSEGQGCVRGALSTFLSRCGIARVDVITAGTSCHTVHQVLSTARHSNPVECDDHNQQDMTSSAACGILVGAAHATPSAITTPPLNFQTQDQSCAHALRNETSTARGATILRKWHRKLGRCIDAAPVLVLLQSCDTSKHPAEKSLSGGTTFQDDGTTLGSVGLVLAASHDGDVACHEHSTGALLWTVRIPSRIEAGLTVAHHIVHRPQQSSAATAQHTPPQDFQVNISPRQQQQQLEQHAACGALNTTSHTCDVGSCVVVDSSYVVVAAGDGSLYSLDLFTGHHIGRAVLQGEPKAAPVTDPHHPGLVWCTSHGRQLLAAHGPDLSIVCRHALPAACSTSPVLYNDTQSNQHYVLVACLDGSIHSWGVVNSSEQGRLSHSTSTTECTEPVQRLALRHAWTVHDVRTPVFSTPTIVTAREHEQQICVIAHVDGNVRGLDAVNGRQVWQSCMQGHVFASLRLWQYSSYSNTSCITPTGTSQQDEQQQQQHNQEQPATCVRKATHHSDGIIVCSHAGQILCLQACTGITLWHHTSDHGRISAAPVVLQGSTWTHHAHGQETHVSSAMATAHVHNSSLVALPFCNGVISILTVYQQAELHGQAEMSQAARHDGVEKTRSIAGGLQVRVDHRDGHRLAGELFSSPVADLCRGLVFTGCRDDNLYCLEIV